MENEQVGAYSSSDSDEYSSSSDSDSECDECDWVPSNVFFKAYGFTQAEADDIMARVRLAIANHTFTGYTRDYFPYQSCPQKVLRHMRMLFNKVLYRV